MALGYLERRLGVGQSVESLMQDFFQSYSLVLDEPAMEKLETRLKNFFQAEEVLPLSDPYKMMHNLIFPESTWFQRAGALDFLKKWFVKQENSMRIWSVGSGLGYEPYSISCCFSEVLHLLSLNALPSIEIIGSEVSAQALDCSKQAVYSKHSLGKGISWVRRRKFFQKLGSANEGFFRLKEPEKERVSFVNQDILKSFHRLGLFDIIFCTQILPYFAKNLRYAVACRLSDRLNPGGYLFLGDVDIDLKQLPDMRRVPIENEIVYQKVAPGLI
jgi:chemotaxis methyl-accepting protein methylase